VEERKRFLNGGNDPSTSKELNEEPYEVKISCTVLYSDKKDDLSVNFSTSLPKIQTMPYLKLSEYD